jgi:hypothetical protein
MGVQDRHRGDNEEIAVENGDTQAAQIWNFRVEYKTQIWQNSASGFWDDYHRSNSANTGFPSSRYF